MSTGTGIQWTEATWNPVAGCSLVSPGCTNCYAMKMAHRLEAMGQQKYAGLTKKVNGHAVWTGKINLDEKALLAPLSWKKPRRVFVNSMSDLFHPDVPFEFVDRVFAVMALCRRHTFQVLTKRPERMAEYMVRTGKSIEFLEKPARELGYSLRFEFEGEKLGLVPWPLRNVWLGTSTEDQQRADERRPHLLKCPAAIRFLSVEPMLGPINLHLGEAGQSAGDMNRRWLGWVIVGGESGPGARPMDIDWARSIIQQCKSAGVACFMKQIGQRPVWNGSGLVANNPKCPSYKDVVLGREMRVLQPRDKKGGSIDEFPEDLRIRQFPETSHA